MVYKRLGDLLVAAGAVRQEQVEEALAYGREHHTRIGESLIRIGAIDEAQLIHTLKMQLGIEFADLSRNPVSPEMAMVIPRALARKHGVLAVDVTPDCVSLAMSDPLNFVAQEEVKRYTHKKVIPMIAYKDALDRAIAAVYGNEGAARAIEEMRRDGLVVAETDESFTSTVLEEGQDDAAPTIRLVNSIVGRAVTEQASDIHIEPQEEGLRVRMRVDGLLHHILDVPKELQNSVISRIKIMGHMDISEHRTPQDGRANVRSQDRDIDLRINTLPTIYGEKVVIRLLDKTNELRDKSKLGMTDDDLKKYMRLISGHAGVVMIVGPTGSGKSSTMQSMIRELNKDEVNVVTLEDPVEYNIPGVNQVQIDEKVGMTFASALRAVLRQDPDVIAVGEIRDGETAEIAMRAALTGHLVLTTVHTNDALSSLDRLNDIGVPAYLTATALNGIVSQRLVRRVCPKCREAYVPDEEELAFVGMKPDPQLRFYRGKGCPMCFGSGYRGRTAVFEILTLDERMRREIRRGADHEKLREATKQADFVSMAENCRRYLLDGTTTTEEVRRVVMGEV